MGFRMILTTQPGIDVVGEAKNGLEAVAAASELRPDVVLMDIRMPELDGIEATRMIVSQHHQPPTRVLMLTTFDLDEYVYDALRAGASGFLLKDIPPDQLAVGVRMIQSGEALLAPTITRRLIEEFTRPRAAVVPPPGLDDLSPREIEVFHLLARGLSNREIGNRLFVEETTVKTHVARILSKLGVRDRVQAVVLAYDAGIVTPDRHPRDEASSARGTPRDISAP